MALVEAMFVIDPDSQYDLGTIVELKQHTNRKYWADSTECLADPNPWIEYLISNRSADEIQKDDTQGIDQNWGREERRLYGIVILDLPIAVIRSFESMRYKFDISVIPQEKRDEFRDKLKRIILNRQEAPISLGGNAFTETDFYKNMIANQGDPGD